jgi:hypothetical protein
MLTPDKIIHIIRYFLKLSVLIRKKPGYYSGVLFIAKIARSDWSCWHQNGPGTAVMDEKF